MNYLSKSFTRFFHQQIGIIFGVLVALKLGKVTTISWGFISSVVFLPLCFWMAVGFVIYFATLYATKSKAAADKKFEEAIKKAQEKP